MSYYYLIQISLWDCHEPGCPRGASQNLCNERNEVVGRYCDKHARKALERFASA